jgi:hypothetical protein
MRAECGQNVLENVGLEDRVEDCMVTLKYILGRQLCRNYRLVELTEDRTRWRVLILAVLNRGVSLAGC